MTNKLKMWTNDGVCLLCGKKAGKMSKDHIPPQCCGNNGAFRVRAYSENSNYNEEIFNKGVYYSTLCQTCNEFLGNNYDYVWGEFTTHIARAMETPLHYPIYGGKLYIDIDPIKLAKSVIGHIIASMNIEGLNGHDIEALKNFVCDTNALFPKGMRLFYWLYPYKDKIVSRNLITLVNRRFEGTTCCVLKIYPIAFMLVWGESQYTDFDDLTPYIERKPIKDIVPIGITLPFQLYKYNYPESTEFSPMILRPSAQSGIIAEKI